MDKEFDIYLYGMVLLTTSFLMKDAYPEADSYGEYVRKVQTCGGETGTCALILSNLGSKVIMDGNHLGTGTYGPLDEIFRRGKVDISPMTFDKNYDGLEDYVITSKESRTCIGRFQAFYSDPDNGRWNQPKKSDIMKAKVVGLDPYFFKETELVSEYAAELEIPYVTIDCKYDSIIHINAEVTIVSHEYLKQTYEGLDFSELMANYNEGNHGLTIFTFGPKELMYGRKGYGIKHFMPFKLNVISTLGAGDSFKAGAIYALSKSMDDEALVAFASATAGLALMHYPISEKLPTLEGIYALIDSRSE